MQHVRRIGCHAGRQRCEEQPWKEGDDWAWPPGSRTWSTASSSQLVGQERDQYCVPLLQKLLSERLQAHYMADIKEEERLKSQLLN